MNSAKIVQELSKHLPQGELAQRSQIARETVSRWATGAQSPSLEALEDLAHSAGFQLDVRLLKAEPALVSRVHELLDLGPTDRLKAQLGQDWHAARQALQAAAALGETAALVGSLAALVSGAPVAEASSSASLLIEEADREAAGQQLRSAGALPERIEVSPGKREHRELWRIGKGRIDLRWRLDGIGELSQLRKRATPAYLNAEDVGLIHVALVEDLLEVAINSSWPEESSLLPELRAVLASGRYSSRKRREESIGDPA